MVFQVMMSAEVFIHTPASRRQRDIAVWPQEGHFINGAWEEARGHSDGKKGVQINGYQSFHLLLSLERAPTTPQSTGVRHQLAQHV